MGQLRTRKRGSTWEWSFEGAKINGKRSPISKGGYRTKADAIAAGTQAKAEYDNAGRTFKPVDISVSDYLDYWYNNYVVTNLAYNTQVDYAQKYASTSNQHSENTDWYRWKQTLYSNS